MLIKIMAVFLAGMAVLAMFGKLRLPGTARRRIARRTPSRRCPDCGRPRIGSSACDCKTKRT